MGDAIQASARRLAATKTYWAAVGSGPNKASADEIRIKLSELVLQDHLLGFCGGQKAHRPLLRAADHRLRRRLRVPSSATSSRTRPSSKPTRPPRWSLPTRGKTVSNPMPKTSFTSPRSVPSSPHSQHPGGSHLGLPRRPGHHEGSRFLHEVRGIHLPHPRRQAEQGLDVYEGRPGKKLPRENCRLLPGLPRSRRKTGAIPGGHHPCIGSDPAVQIPVRPAAADRFRNGFRPQGHGQKCARYLFRVLGSPSTSCPDRWTPSSTRPKPSPWAPAASVNGWRASSSTALADHEMDIAQVINRNVIVMKNIQGVIDHVKGSILYRIDGLGLLGDPPINHHHDSEKDWHPGRIALPGRNRPS
jgi:glucosamine--fructose-6-phosphate aminotransferase (isomerizing)